MGRQAHRDVTANDLGPADLARSPAARAPGDSAAPGAAGGPKGGVCGTRVRYL